MEQKKKSTDDLLSEMKNSGDYESYRRENSKEFVGKKMRVSRALTALLAEKGLVKKDVIKRSCLQEKYAYQIFSGIRDNPSRDKVLALCIAMGLTLEEIQKLLKITGYSQLYPRDPRDNVIIYGIEKKKSVFDIGYILEDLGMDVLE